MSNKFTPRFQTVEQRKVHQEKRHNDDRSNQKISSKKSDFKHSRRNEHSSDHKNAQIWVSEGKKAGNKTGSVQIQVKGNKGIGEKKTGPLSPRAPEKIRKNRAEEMKIYGENSCLTVFQQRPEAIVRLWATVEIAKKMGELLTYLAENKKAYHIVDNEELARVTGTEHHGGICLLIKKSPALILEGYLAIPRQRDCLMLLDSVHNALNIGGVIRTCAFYGVKGIIVENPDSVNSSSAARVAEGGLEFITPLETKHKQIALAQLRKAGYQVIHLTRYKQAPTLAKVTLTSKVVFVLSEIVSAEIEYPEDTTVQLSLDNPLNSGLNVAVSAGIVLSQWYQANIL